MKISLRTEVSTSGAHEGLLISTGFFTTDASQPPFRHFMPPSFYNVGGNSTELLVPQMSLHPQNEQNQDMTRPRSRDEQQINEEAKTLCSPPLTSPSMTETEPSAPIIAAQRPLPQTAIKLNLFSDENASSKYKCTELVPLVRFHSSATPSPIPMNNAGIQQKCQRQLSSPMLCDTTTSTTTIEVFRARPDSVHFFQLPKGPLSTAKQNVELISVDGPEYERMDRSETQFSDRINSTRHDLAPAKSLQWDESLSIPQYPYGRRDLSPVSPMPLAPFSPPQQCSTPHNFDQVGLQRSTNAFPQMEPIVLSPLSGDVPVQSDDLTTVMRRQWLDRSERFLRQRKIDSADEDEEAKIPPRPLKCRHRRMPFGENAEAPPRPPKPTKYLRKSKSADFVTSKDLTRSTASDNIFKLYQTRDCLGRIVCEW